MAQETYQDLEKVPNAVAVLIEAIKNDPDVRRAWQANIAVAIQDECPVAENDFITLNRKQVWEMSQKAADRFLDLLIM
jgi:hypothetical protein